jgi:hypothetical protein
MREILVATKKRKRYYETAGEKNIAVPNIIVLWEYGEVLGNCWRYS